MKPKKEPEEVTALYDGVSNALDTDYGDGRKIGNSKCGVYLFFDYDGEPIYVGRTRESLRGRIGRHLTNQRTDAVAMSVLDPFEVAEIEMWPFWDLDSDNVNETLDRAEYTVYQNALRESKFSVVGSVVFYGCCTLDIIKYFAYTCSRMVSAYHRVTCGKLNQDVAKRDDRLRTITTNIRPVGIRSG